MPRQWTEQQRKEASERAEAQWRTVFKSKGPRTFRKFTAEQVGAVKKLRAGGKSLGQIAKKTGISAGYVVDIIHGRARQKDAGPDPVRGEIDRALLAMEMNGLATSLWQEGRYDEAAEIARELIEMFGQSPGGVQVPVIK